MNNLSDVSEQKLQAFWQSYNFNKTLRSLDGDEIVILDKGILNVDEAGPDFKNARIRIGNLTYVGDIELDISYSDWKSHGHNIDRKYNHVILHTCLNNKFNQAYVYSKDGRRIHSVSLVQIIDAPLIKELKKDFPADATDGNRDCTLKCAHLSNMLEFSTKKKYLSQLGYERFNKKCERIYFRLKELLYIKEMKLKEPVVKYDLSEEFLKRKFSNSDFFDRDLWEQLLYELIFEALGYSKNKTIMLNLAQNADIGFIKKLGNDEELLYRIESALFHIAGLIPDQSKLNDSRVSSYLQKLNEEWEFIRRIYDAKTFDKESWHFLKMRPQNFPTVRLAGGARILVSIIYGNLIEILIKKVKEIRNLNVLINSLKSLFVVKGDGFWTRHFVFDEAAKIEIKYFVGVSRADEIVINVLLPFLSVYFDVFGKEDLSKKIFQIFNVYKQSSENKIVKEVADCLLLDNLAKRTIIQQGMLELFRNLCSKGKCLDCEIGKIVFN